MLAPETAAIVDLWIARKNAQWKEVEGTMPGLQLIRSGPLQSSFMLVCSTDDFYDGVMIGQLPQTQTEVVRRAPKLQIRDVPERRKLIDRRSIDLSDSQISQIVAGWRNGCSALELPFVIAVWGRDGQVRQRG